jgi:Tol biopolymer transport system component
MQIGLFRLDLRNGRSAPLIPPMVEASDIWPALSPDGKRLAFVRMKLGFQPRIALFDLATRRLTVRPDEFEEIVSLAWAGDGERLFASGARGRENGVWVSDLTDDTIRRLPIDIDRVRRVANGAPNALIVESVTEWFHLYQVDLNNSNLPPVRLSASTAADTHASFAPDNRTLAVVSSRTGAPEIWLKRSNGSMIQLTSLGADDLYDVSWSPSGDTLLFATRRGRLHAIHTLDVALRLRTDIVSDPAAKTDPVWSPDGRAIYYAAARGEGWRIWRTELATGRTTPVSPLGFVVARPSADGRYLYLSDRVAPRIERLSLADGTIETFFAGPPNMDPYAWRVTDDAIYFALSQLPSGNVLMEHRRRDGRERQIAVTEFLRPESGLEISPDGSKLIFSRRALSEIDLIRVDLKS